MDEREKRNCCNTVARKPEGKRPFRIPRFRWESNIKMYVKETWELLGFINGGTFLTWRRTLLHVLSLVLSTLRNLDNEKASLNTPRQKAYSFVSQTQRFFLSLVFEDSR
jgi:hypothetical protein